MSGKVSPRRRSPCATRQLNPELSIVTTASGRSARIAATVSRTRRRITGARGRTSATPMIARSPSGTRLSSPCSRMRSPPIPATRSRPPVRCRSAAISAPPSASPDGSPVTMKMKVTSSAVTTRRRRPGTTRPRRRRGSPRRDRARSWRWPRRRSRAIRFPPPTVSYALQSSADRRGVPDRASRP